MAAESLQSTRTTSHRQELRASWAHVSRGAGITLKETAKEKNGPVKPLGFVSDDFISSSTFIPLASRDLGPKDIQPFFGGGS